MDKWVDFVDTCLVSQWATRYIGDTRVFRMDYETIEELGFTKELTRFLTIYIYMNPDMVDQISNELELPIYTLTSAAEIGVDELGRVELSNYDDTYLSYVNEWVTEDMTCDIHAI